MLKPITTAAALLLASPALAATSDCSEICLLDLATSYLDGLGVGDASEVPLSPEHRVWVNGTEADLRAGIWTTGSGWTYRHTVADAVSGEAVTLGVIREGEAQAFVAVRIKQDGGLIEQSEILVSREGDFSLFQPGGPRDADPVFGAFIPAERRQSRGDLERIARGYFQALIHSDPKLAAFHPDCNRVENNVQTTNGARVGSSSCSEGIRRFAYMRGYHGLRFPVIDPARGLVMTALFLDMPLQERTITVRGKPVEISAERNRLPRSLYLFELFKIEDGRIRRIEAVLRDEPYGTRLAFGGEEAEAKPLAD